MDGSVNSEGVELQDPVRPARVCMTAQDAVYITIGFAVLAFQRAQVLRREFERSLPRRGQ